MCENKVKQNCGTVVYGSCVRYEKEVNTQSELDGLSCISIEETTQDIYNQLSIILGKLDMSSIENDCIVFSEPRTPISVIKQLLDKLCSLESIVSSQGALILTLQGQVAALQANVCP